MTTDNASYLKYLKTYEQVSMDLMEIYRKWKSGLRFALIKRRPLPFYRTPHTIMGTHLSQNEILEYTEYPASFMFG